MVCINVRVNAKDIGFPFTGSSALNLLLQTVFALWLYLCARFSGERFDRHLQGSIFHNVEVVLQNLDAKEKLSLTALFVDGKLKPSDFIFEIRDPAARAMWMDAGFQVMPDPKKLALAVTASGLLAALFSPLYRCANLVYPVSFIASYELILFVVAEKPENKRFYLHQFGLRARASGDTCHSCMW